MSELTEWLMKYSDRFGENFPTMFLRGTPPEKLITIIQKCLDDGKPYETPDLDGEEDI